MKIYLHIGTRKTGTSSIQAMCRTSVKQLNKLGYYWPVELDGHPYPHHEPLATWLKKGDVEKVQNEIGQHIKQAQSLNMHSMIFSSEAFYIMEEDHIEQLLSCFKGHQVTVQLFLRNIYDYARSDLFQFLKHSHTHRPLSVIIDRIASSADYENLLNIWCRHLNSEQLTVVSYDKHKADIKTAYLQAIGIVQQTDIDLFPTIKSNISLDNSTHLLLSGIGFYGANYSAKKIKGPFLRALKHHQLHHIFIDQIIELLLATINTAYTHPKLIEMQSSLTRPPATMSPENLSTKKINRYLRYLAGFLFFQSCKSTIHQWVKKLSRR